MEVSTVGRPKFVIFLTPDSLRKDSLEIPRRFVTTYGGDVESVVKLFIPNSDVFEVIFVPEKNCFLCISAFVEKYLLCSYCSLVFEYVGGSCFSMYALNPFAIEVDYPLHCATYGCNLNPSYGVSFPSDAMIDYLNLSLLKYNAIGCVGKGIEYFCHTADQFLSPNGIVIGEEYGSIFDCYADGTSIYLSQQIRRWEVKLKVSGFRWCISTGWLQFAHEIGLAIGDMLILRPTVDKKVFHVFVFKAYDSKPIQRPPRCYHPCTFIKMIDHGSLTIGELSIPRLYVSKYIKRLPVNLELQRRGCSTKFAVRYEKLQKKITGLAVVFEALSVKVGDIVTFSYKRKGLFDLSIFTYDESDV